MRNRDNIFVVLIGDRVVATFCGKATADSRAAKLRAIGLNAKVAGVTLGNRVPA